MAIEQPNPSASALPPRAADPVALKRGRPGRAKAVLCLVLLTACAVGGRMWWRSYYFEQTDNAYLAGHVSSISSRIPGVVSKVLVSENQLVQQGDLLAELDHADQAVRVEQIKAQLAQVDAQAGQGGAQVEQAKSEALAVGYQLVRAQAQLKRAEADAARYASLYRSQMKAVSKSELDAAVAAHESTAADVRAQGDQVRAAQAKIGVSEFSKTALLAQKRVLAAQLQDAELQLSYTRILAPVSGRIGRKNLEVGIRVQSGQQLLGIVQQGGWVTANFKETQISTLFAGQRASVRIDAFPGREFSGRVESFSPASGAQFSLLPPDNATGNFTKIVQRVPVKIVFDAKDMQAIVDRIAPGMSAVVEIDLRQSNPAAKPVVTASN